MKLKLLNAYQQSPMSKSQSALLLSLLLSPPADAKVEECIELAHTCLILRARLNSVES